MYRAPVEGTVKTRLAKTIGSEKALALYRWLGLRQLEAALEAGKTEVRYAPDNAESAMREWLGDEVECVPQGLGELGERMERAVEAAFAETGTERVILIGADCPSLDAAALREAEDCLGEADVAIGPAEDGGYYLLGLKRAHASLFAEIPWGTDRVLERTIERCREAGLKVALLERREDVDDWESLQRQKAYVDTRLWDCIVG